MQKVASLVRSPWSGIIGQLGMGLGLSLGRAGSHTSWYGVGVV